MSEVNQLTTITCDDCGTESTSTHELVVQAMEFYGGVYVCHPCEVLRLGAANEACEQ